MCDKFRAKKGRPVPCNNDDSIRFPRGWVAAADDGEIYGWESFKERGLYTPGMEDPNICDNFYDYPKPNSTIKYRFVLCPTPDLNGTFNWCCGDRYQQKCCNYHSHYHLLNIDTITIVCIAVSILLAFCCCAFGVYCVVRRSKKRRSAAPTYQPPPPAVLPPYDAQPKVDGQTATTILSVKQVGHALTQVQGLGDN